MRLFVRVLCILAALFAAHPNVFSAPRICMVIAPTDFTDREYADPRAVFDQAGAAVVVASTGRGTAVGHDGLQVRVEAATADLKSARFDAFVVVGGMGALSSLLNDAPLLALLRSASESGKVVAAICVAPAVLARAGVLHNRAATCYSDAAIVTALKINGADYQEARVVTSGRIVTANGPEAAREFALRVLEVLRNG
jgi:protease I